MKNYYELNKLITISDVDSKYNLRIDNLLNIIQDISTFHSYELKVDRETLVNSSNAFWVLSKLKLVFNKLPKWNEQITFKTWPTTLSTFRFFREFAVFSNSCENAIGNSEWCLLDATTKTLRKSDSINYPTQMEHLPANPNMPTFERIRVEVLKEDYNYTYKVAYTDLDCNNHTNNVSYVKMALNAFTPQELDEILFKGIEINFLNQTYYGDMINIYKKKCEDGYYIEGKIEDKKIFILKFYM